MKLILAAIALCGLYLIVDDAVLSKARRVALWSDYFAFQARLRQAGHAEEVLALGGERDDEDLRQLWERVLRDVRGNGRVGVLLLALSLTGSVLEYRRRPNSNNAPAADAAPPGAPASPPSAQRS